MRRRSVSVRASSRRRPRSPRSTTSISQARALPRVGDSSSPTTIRGVERSAIPGRGRALDDPSLLGTTPPRGVAAEQGLQLREDLHSVPARAVVMAGGNAEVARGHERAVACASLPAAVGVGPGP